MNKTGIKREALFKKYADNLQLLAKNKLLTANGLDKYVYICPVCLQHFENVDGSNPLTLEDAPPKSLGGKASILTCKKCNNVAGTAIDAHLSTRLNELDERQLLAGTQLKVMVRIDGEAYAATLKVEQDGKMTMLHSKRNNNPTKLESAMEQLKAGSIVDMEYVKSMVIPERFDYALLKTAYLLAFQYIGYGLMLDACYDDVRNQIQHPGQAIYPSGFWFTPDYPKEMVGTYFITEAGLESLFVFFQVRTVKTERMFAVILPLPGFPVGTVIGRLAERLAEEKEFHVSLYPDKPLDYITDVENIKAMHRWIAQHRTDDTQPPNV